MTKDEVFNEVKLVLIRDFKVSEDTVCGDTLLANDLGLDSIDFIDILVKMRKFIPQDKGNINPMPFKFIKTMGDLVDFLYPYMK